MADVDYDYEKILQGIAQAQELRIEEEQLVLVFCVLSLVTH
jgi:flagellar assembly factor FliW